MATSGWFSYGLYRCMTDLDITSSVFKVGLFKTTAAWDPDETAMNTSLTAVEIVATNYTGGYGGSGRKTATITGQNNTTDNRADFTCADLTYTALGGATNDTIGAVVLLYETGGSDATAFPVVFWDVTNLTCNGGDVVVDFPTLVAGGAMRISVGSP